SYAPALNGAVKAMLTQSDGKVLIVGDFMTVSGTSSNRIARLNVDGTLDTTFTPGTGASATIRCIALESETGRILIGGDFTSYYYYSPGYYIGGAFTSVGGVTRNRFARVTYYGSVDSSFPVGTGANGTVYAIYVPTTLYYSSTSSVYLGGDFTSFNGVGRAHL